MGCYFLFQCMKVKSESEVAQSCPTLRDPMDCSLPGSSVHWIFQVRVLEWGAITFPTLHINSQLPFAVCIKAPRSYRPRSGCSHHPDAVFSLTAPSFPHCRASVAVYYWTPPQRFQLPNFFFFLMVCCG